MSRTGAAPPDPYDAYAPADPYGTAALRRRVLEAWAASPARFREDANAEEDLALGGHRDRLVVELAQNAADAARRAGVPGRLRLALGGGVLRASNTGAPLDAAGVQALATLRASAKRDDDGSAGRFGVGFAAVAAVCDEPVVASRDGAVAFSRTRTADAVAVLPSLRDEVGRRAGSVPVLRLPWPVDATAEPGYDTTVVLPLRDGDAVATVERLLAGVDGVLLLALPGLGELVVESGERRRVLTIEREADLAVVDDDGVRSRWRLESSAGSAAAEVLADRPVEERSRRAWQVTWALPVDGEGVPAPLPAGVEAVVRAPTPTDEPLGLPAVLLGTFPLDPARRHVAAGPLRDLLVGAAGETFGRLVASLPATPALLGLVPAAGAAAALDAEIRRAATTALRSVRWLPAAVAGQRLRTDEAVAVEGADDALVRALAPLVGGLLPAAAGRRATTLNLLGVRRLSVADVVDAMAGTDRPPHAWRELYDALATAPRDELGALPVPLADGRLVRGPRGLLLPDGDLPADLGLLGLRVVAADATHPLLERLGALRATPRAVLEDPAVRAAVAGSYLADADDPEAVADAVLALVAAAGVRANEAPWLGDLALVDDEGELAPARALVLPGGPAARVLDEDAVGRPDPSLLERWDRDVLAAVGVLDGLALTRDGDVVLDADACDHDLDDEDTWIDEVAGEAADADGVPPVAPELVAVRDLDLVRDDAWAEVLRQVAADRDLRGALVEPLALLRADGRRAHVPSYTGWWLRRHARLAGQAPGDVRDPAGDPLLAGLWPDAPPLAVDAAVLRAAGVRTSLADVLAERGGADAVLERLAAPGADVSRAQLHAVYAALAGVDPDDVSPPAVVRVPDGAGSTVVPARDVLVVDAPDLLPYATGGALPFAGAVAAALAEILDVPLASLALDPAVTSHGTAQPVPEVVGALLPDAPATWVEHEVVVAGGREVDWRVVDGVVHAATMDGLARGLAWATGQWGRRWAVAALLASPRDAAPLLATLLDEADLEAAG